MMTSDRSERRRLRIVVLNWRDRAHPQVGGAELYCESLGRALAERGHQVTLLTSRPKGAPHVEQYDGILVRRAGGTLTVYPSALWWLLRHRRRVDGVVDCQNGIPFFSPLVTRRLVPVVCVIFHVHQEQFDQYFRWPLNLVGRWLESTASRWVYGRRTIATISPSSRSAIRQRLQLKGAIHMVPCGMDPPAEPATAVVRSAGPRIACVGRVVRHKRLHLLLEALPEVLSQHPGLTVDIAGDGPGLAELEELRERLALTSVVTFHGRVSDAERSRLLGEAWLTVNPSVGEGWGLSVIESNASGLPAIAFRVPGLQDAVRDGRTGWLIDEGAWLSPAISEALTALIDPEVAAGWSARARAWAACFSWDQATTRLEATLDYEAARLQREPSRGRPSRERRHGSDLACRIELPINDETLAIVPTLCRATDLWGTDGDTIVALLHDTDERGVRVALERVGLTGAAQVSIVRPSDWLIGGLSPWDHGATR